MSVVLRVRARKEPGMYRAGIFWPHTILVRVVDESIADRVKTEPLLAVEVLDALPVGWDEHGNYTPPKGKRVEPPAGAPATHVETLGDKPPVEDEEEREQSMGPSKPVDEDEEPPAPRPHKRHR